jgi:hypothetical protein
VVVSQALVPVDPARRSIVTFAVRGDPWEHITAWAKRNGFKPRSDSGTTKLFQKGTGLWTSPMRAQFTVLEKGKIELQAWVHNLLLSRVLTLFLLPTEMNVRSGGFRAMVPRSIARRAVNELLREMKATEIP